MNEVDTWASTASKKVSCKFIFPIATSSWRYQTIKTYFVSWIDVIQTFSIIVPTALRWFISYNRFFHLLLLDASDGQMASTFWFTSKSRTPMATSTPSRWWLCCLLDRFGLLPEPAKRLRGCGSRADGVLQSEQNTRGILLLSSGSPNKIQKLNNGIPGFHNGDYSTM